MDKNQGFTWLSITKKQWTDSIYISADNAMGVTLDLIFINYLPRDNPKILQNEQIILHLW
jgi:hypothetical protein